MSFYQSLRNSVEKRVRYEQTVRELRALSPDVAADLNIDRRNVRTIARTAVYGL